MASLEYFTAFKKKRGIKAGIGGPLPDSLGNLFMMSWFDVSDNSITGQIPAAIGDMTNMEYLILNGNSLDGDSPTELGNVGSIKEFYLTNNNLSGRVPKGLCGLDADIQVDCSVLCLDGCCTDYDLCEAN